MDMSAAYAKGVGLALPGAAISYDRFKRLVDSALVVAKVDTTAKPNVGGDTARSATVPAKGPGGE